MTTTYEITVNGTFILYFRADFSQAASPIEVDYGHGWQSTALQVADAKHRPERAVDLLQADLWGDEDEVEVVELSKDSVRDWKTVATYVVDFDDGAADVRVQIGPCQGGQWYMRTTDDFFGPDDARDTSYPSETEATSAAQALASDLHAGLPGEDAEAYLDRMQTESIGTPDPAGRWACYWATVDASDCYPLERYATHAQAAAAVERANAQLSAHHPGGNLLCWYEIRVLGEDGSWIYRRTA